MEFSDFMAGILKLKIEKVLKAVVGENPVIDTSNLDNSQKAVHIIRGTTLTVGDCIDFISTVDTEDTTAANKQVLVWVEQLLTTPITSMGDKHVCIGQIMDLVESDAPDAIKEYFLSIPVV